MHLLRSDAVSLLQSAQSKLDANALKNNYALLGIFKKFFNFNVL